MIKWSRILFHNYVGDEMNFYWRTLEVLWIHFRKAPAIILYVISKGIFRMIFYPELFYFIAVILFILMTEFLRATEKPCYYWFCSRNRAEAIWNGCRTFFGTFPGWVLQYKENKRRKVSLQDNLSPFVFSYFSFYLDGFFIGYVFYPVVN